MLELFLSVLVKGAVFKEETVFLHSKMVAFSVLATFPIMFILNFLAKSQLTATRMLSNSAVQAGANEIIVEQIKENDDDDMQCAVCLCEVSKGEKIKILPTCKHGYHLSCIDSWLHTNPSCPICRSEVKVKCMEEQCRSKVVASILKSYFEGFCKWFLGLSTDPMEDGHYFY